MYKLCDNCLCDKIFESTRNSLDNKEELQNGTQQLKDSISLIKSIRDDITGCAQYEQPGEETVEKMDEVIAKLESINMGDK